MVLDHGFDPVTLDFFSGILTAEVRLDFRKPKVVGLLLLLFQAPWSGTIKPWIIRVKDF